MQAVTTIGLDIAKSVFQVHGVDAQGTIAIRRPLKRRAGAAILQEAAALPCRYRSLCYVASLVSSATGARPHGASDAAGVREATSKVRKTMLPMPRRSAKPSCDRAMRFVNLLERKSSCRSAIGKFITLIRTGIVTQKDGSVTLQGKVEETGERAVLMVWGNALSRSRALGGGVHAYAEMDRNKLPADHPPAASRDGVQAPNADEEPEPTPAPAEPAVAPFAKADRQALEAKAVTIDVMLLYTARAAKHYIRDPSDLLALAIEETNQTLKNSGLGNIILRLVHSQLVDYDASEDDHFTTSIRWSTGSVRSRT